MGLKWGAVHPESSIQATLEVGLIWATCEPLTNPDVVIGWLDAALEYWIIKHKEQWAVGNVYERFSDIHPYNFSDKNGWQCSCLEDQ